MNISTDHNRPVIVLVPYMPKKSNGGVNRGAWRKYNSGKAKFKSWSIMADGMEHSASAIVERPNGNVETVWAENVVFTDNPGLIDGYEIREMTAEEVDKL